MLELIGLVLYGVQWLGVVLGVGAESVLLVAYLVALHRGESDAEHRSFVRALRVAQGGGLLLIVASGFGAIGWQVAAGQAGVIFAPAFLFKWLVIVALIFGFYAEPRVERLRTLFEGAVGALWYALFLVHVVAPVIDWLSLTAFVFLWFVSFVGFWSVAAFAMRLHKKKFGDPARAAVVAQAPLVAVAPRREVVRQREQAAPQVVEAPQPAPPPPAPKPATPPPAVPKAPVTAALPVVEHLELTAPKAPPVAVAAPAAPKAESIDHTVLPALHVMPQNEGELGKQFRGPVAQMQFS